MFGWSPQKSRDVGFQVVAGSTALVTGSSGLCGARLVEMLLQRGAKRVVAFDVTRPDRVLQERLDRVQNKTGGKIIVKYGIDGDITSDAAVEAAFRCVDKIHICFHIAALVGPFHKHEMYMKVNFHGTERIIKYCRQFDVPKLVYSSSPSTRFTGGDVTGQSEDELPMPDRWLVQYAEAKAYGEMVVTKACCQSLMTISVAPHQIYGPHDSLFLPKLLETAGNDRLRIFGKGDNKISVCFVDNYCHGLLCGADALYLSSPALGKFYIVTDGEPQYFWTILNQAIVAMGFTDLHHKWHLPVWLLLMIAYVANVVGWLLRCKFKLNPFNVKMLTIHRYFSIERAKRDLKYKPVVPFEEAWPLTIEWFKVNWLPTFQAQKEGKKLK